MIKKSRLTTITRLAGYLEERKASAYVAIQLPAGMPPLFYRSSPVSLVQSKEFDPRGKWYFVSFLHLVECLKGSAETFEMSVDDQGQVCLESFDGPYRTVMHLHTVDESDISVAYHDIGERDAQRIDPASFSGIDVSNIDIVLEPSLIDGKLYLSTQGGFVKWQMPEHMQQVTANPRVAFLKFACGVKLDLLSLSSTGYWVAYRDGMVGCSASHNVENSLLQTYNVPSQTVATMDATRLIGSLRSTLPLCGLAGQVYIEPEKGVTCLDKFRHEVEFNVGTFPIGAWDRFGMSRNTVKLLVDVLEQSRDKEVILQTIVPNFGGPAMRMTRGAFEVDFRVSSCEQ